MRSVLLASMGALVAAFVAIPTNGGTQAEPGGSTSGASMLTSAVQAAEADVDQTVESMSSTPVATPPVQEAQRQERPQEAQSQERTQEAGNARDDNRRRFRRRSRNRYPGPIPTPEDWRPPEGPVRIALQAGHWRANEAPSELSGLRRNGTSWEGMAEWEVNLEIAERAGAMLEELGYEVDILPAVVPPSYRAHLFIAIHADANGDPGTNGYRIAAPRRDATGRASQVVELLQQTYGEATGLGLFPTVTRRMSNYYAFNFRRYEHALHPMTIAVIIETGFLTSRRDRGVIVNAPERAARGIVDAVTAFPITALPVATSG